MTHSCIEQQIAAAWNAQADEFNQWDELDFEEKIEWAAKWGASQQSRVQGLDAKDYRYFSYDTEVGIEFHNTEAEAIKRCEELLQVYRKEAYSDGWYEEVEALRWGVVLGLAVKVDERPAPEGSEFECLCDYTLQSVAERYAEEYSEATKELRRLHAESELHMQELREALKELISWIPSADTYRRLGFDPEAPMRAYEAAKVALANGDVV